MSTMYNFTSTLIPTLIVGTSVIILDITNNMRPQDAILWIDVIMNIVSYLISRFSVLNIADLFGSDLLFQYYIDIIFQPVFNGVILGSIYKFGFSRASLKRMQDKTKYNINKDIFTFQGGVAKGVLTDLLSNYLYNPLVSIK